MDAGRPARRSPDWPVVLLAIAFLAVGLVLFRLALPPELPPCAEGAEISIYGDSRLCGNGLAEWTLGEFVSAAVAGLCVLAGAASVVFAARRSGER